MPPPRVLPPWSIACSLLLKKALLLLQAVAVTLSKHQSAHNAAKVYGVTSQTLMRACACYR